MSSHNRGHSDSISSITSTISSTSARPNPFPTQASTLPDDDGNLDNSSTYSSHTLRTIHNPDGSVGGSDDEDDEMPHIVHVRNGSNYDDDNDGAAMERDAHSKATSVERRRTIVRAFAKLAILFVVCSIVMGGTLYVALPEVDEADKADLKIPKNFDQLKALNVILQRYKDENFGRVMLCWIVVYIYLQAFSIPGSMYMSILAGAMWGVPLALPIVCASVATGATICYLISKFLGQVLVAIPSWKARVDGWKVVLDRQRDDMLSYLIVIRMMPLPPHNIVNILAPHLGIKIPLFWISTFFGIFAVSVIHTTIGEKLDQMTSPADFNLFNFRNALLLGGVCAAVMVPVVLRKRSAAAQMPLEEPVVPSGAVRLEGDEGVSNGHGASRSLLGRKRIGRSGSDDGEDDDDELPPVRMRGAIAGFSRKGGTEAEEIHGEDDDDDDESTYSAGHYRSARSSVDGEEQSLRGFDDRREQARGRSSLNGVSHHTRTSTHNSKASRVLGLGSSTGGGSSTAVTGPTGAGPSIADSVVGLWGKISGDSSRR